MGMPKLLKPEEVCEALGINKRRLYNMASQNELPRVKVGQNIRFRQDDIISYIEENTIHTT